MKSAALELGQYNITVNALIPGLINTPLTRHKDRYEQVLETAGQSPTGLSAATEKESARKILIPKSPWRALDRARGRRGCCSLSRLRRGARMVSGATYDVTGGNSANNSA
jgi:NAD(P)-dependent dehydrogenase (short-subunit alcohol dehydrogenase family)